MKAQRDLAQLPLAAMLETILDAMTDSVLIFDRNGAIQYANAATYRLLDIVDMPNFLSPYVAELLPRLHLRDSAGQPVAPEHAVSGRVLQGESFAGKDAVDLLLRTRRGKDRRISLCGAPIRDAAGEIIGGVTISRDITARRRTEAALREREAQFRALFEQASIGIVQVNAQGRFLVMNRKFCDILGYREAELHGHTFADFTHPDDLPTNVAYFQDVINGRRTSFTLEKRYRRKDGTFVWVEVTVSPVKDETNVVKYCTAVVQDISERHYLVQQHLNAVETANQQLALLQLVLDELPSAVYLVQGNDARLVMANQITANIWGATWQRGQSLDAFLREHGIRVLTPDRQPLPLEAFATIHALQWDERVREHRQIIVRPDGTTLPVVLNTVAFSGAMLPFTSQTETPEIGALVVIHDMTTYQETERLKDEFIAIATHELRNPVTILKGYVQLLLNETAAADISLAQKEILYIIDAATNSLTALTAELLEITQLDGNRLLLHTAPQDLVALTQRVVADMDVTASEHHLEFEASSAPIIVVMDEPRIEQILRNLLINAIKYSPGGGTITVTLSSDPVAQTALVCVRDHGIGIPKAQQAHIFERFVRADNARASGIPGTGLGLYLCKGLAERHGGRLWFSSGEGDGARFFLTLPLSTDPSGPAPQAHL